MAVKQNFDGHIRLEIEGIALEDVLNQAIQEGLTIWDVRRHGSKADVCVALGDFRALVRLIKPYRCRIHILERKGWPFLVAKVRKRQGLMIGAGLFFILAYLATSFVWSYEAIGNERFSEGQLIAIVQGYGVLPGESLHNIDFDAVRENLLADYPDMLSWADISHHGTKVIIRVRELDNQAAKDGRAAHLVANHDGIVKEILIMQGIGRVQKEQSVHKGDVLIAGLTYERREKLEDGTYDWSGPPIYTRARGIVEGYVDYQATAICPLSETILQETGRTKKTLILQGPKGTWRLWGDEETQPFHIFRQVVRTKKLFSGKNYQSAWFWQSVTYYEEAPKVINRTLQEAYQEAIRRAREKVAFEAGADSQVVNESIQMVESAADVVQVQITWRVLQNLAVPQFLEN